MNPFTIFFIGIISGWLSLILGVCLLLQYLVRKQGYDNIREWWEDE